MWLKKNLVDFEDKNSLNNDQAFEKVEMLFWKLLKNEYWSSLANVWNNIYVDGYGWKFFGKFFKHIFIEYWSSV